VPTPVVKEVKPAESEITELGGTTEPIETHYDFGKQLGAGAFSIVREGLNKKQNKKLPLKLSKRKLLKEMTLNC